MNASRIIFHDNGNTAVFDHRGQQLVEVQIPWLNAWLAHAEAKGLDIDPKDDLTIIMPGGKAARLVTVEKPDEWPNFDWALEFEDEEEAEPEEEGEADE